MSGIVVASLTLLVAVPVILITVPLRFRVNGHLAAIDSNLLIDLVWASGLAKVRVTTGGQQPCVAIQLAGIRLRERHQDGRKREQAGKPAKARKAKHQKTGLSLSTIRSFLSRELLSRFLVYLGSVLAALRLELNLSGRYGTGDPALTGILAGILGALAYPASRLDLVPVFDGPHLNLRGSVQGRLVPIVILWLTVRLLLAGPVRRLWWAHIFNRKRKQKEVTLSV